MAITTADLLTPASALPAVSSGVPSGRALGRAGSSSGGDAYLTGASGKTSLPSAGTTRTPASNRSTDETTPPAGVGAPMAEGVDN